LGGIGTGIYFFTKNSSSTDNPQPNQNPDNPSIQYLPSEEEAQTKINQIQQKKGIDEQQATIEFLTQYVPYIKWWEINSLSELDEKIALVNNQTGFSPFKEVPEVDKFNKEVESNMQKKAFLFLASIIPRKADNTPDWKGITDFQSYMLTVMKPIMEDIKFKPSFATQSNYQELARRLKEEVNPQLVNICLGFASLSNVNNLNTLTNNYLSKIFQGYIYADAIHDELGQQLNITNHQKFKLEGTGNASENEEWEIALNEFGFKGGSEPPEPSGNEYQLLEKDLQFIRDKFNSIKNRKEQEEPDLKWLKQLPFNNWMCFEQDQVNGLPEIEKLQTELSTHANDKSWLTQTRNKIRQKHDWLFKNFQNKDEALDFLKNNEHRFKYVNKVWQNK